MSFRGDAFPPRPAAGPGAEDRRTSDAGNSPDRPWFKGKVAIGIGLVLLVAAALWGLSASGLLATFLDEHRLRETVESLGVWGPLATVALMIAAIVASPVPSGPIAMAAGAAYGPFWGTVLVVIGAEAGALIAFGIARYFGYEAVRRSSNKLLSWLSRRRSQTALMGIVFASRLIPFISFDAVSYAAGLTALTFWRFALATLCGVVPVSFALTYLGDEFIAAPSGPSLWILLLLSGITLVPIIAGWIGGRPGLGRLAGRFRKRWRWPPRR